MRLYTVLAIVTFTPVLFMLARKDFNVYDVEGQKLKPKSKGGLVKFLDIVMLKKLLIFDYVNRQKKGELKKLRDIFEKTSRSLDISGNAFDINKKDHELDEEVLGRITQEIKLRDEGGKFFGLLFFRFGGE